MRGPGSGNRGSRSGPDSAGATQVAGPGVRPGRRHAPLRLGGRDRLHDLRGAGDRVEALLVPREVRPSTLLGRRVQELPHRPGRHVDRGAAVARAARLRPDRLDGRRLGIRPAPPLREPRGLSGDPFGLHAGSALLDIRTRLEEADHQTREVAGRPGTGVCQGSHEQAEQERPEHGAREPPVTHRRSLR